ncbi:penguin containing pumolio repeat protein [Cryptosporidium bovis]|uniref:penguin containing pumolio repeat protein n=1 Tax=Cryptosporidium bovis TaxID=310047 RepID=UPI00351A6A89|nr:penguin containing pumolio repeat protein [Cryptosporidium bovis]
MRKHNEKKAKNDDLNKEFKATYSHLLQISSKKNNKPPDSKEVLETVEKLWNLIKAKFLQVCRKPVYSRGIQSLLKWGSDKYKVAIFEKMKNYLIELSIDSHSSKIVEKMYNYGNSDTRKKIRDELLDKFEQLGFTKYGSRVFGYIFSDKRNQSDSIESMNNAILHKVLSTKLADFYGMDNLNKVKYSSFIDFFTNINEENAKKSILDNSVNIIQKFVDGELLDRQFVHLLIWNYIKCCICYYNDGNVNLLKKDSNTVKGEKLQFISLDHITDEGKSSLISLLEQIIEGSYSLLSTKEGVDSLIVLLGLSKAQQRKKILKNIKKDVYELSTNPVDYSLILRLLSTTDDTKILGEVIINSFIKDGCVDDKLLANINSIKLLSYLLVSRASSRCFNQYDLWVLNLKSFTSLKSEETRKNELNRTLIPALCNTIFGISKQDQTTETIIEMLIKNQNGKELFLLLLQYIIQKIRGDESNISSEYYNYISELINSISSTISNNGEILKDVIAHRTLVSILKIANEGESNISCMFDLFRNTLIQVFESDLREMLKSRAVFVIVEMIGQIHEKNDFKSCTTWRVRIKELIKGEIQSCICELKEEGNSTTGIELLAKYADIEVSPNCPENNKNNSLEPTTFCNKKQINKRQKSEAVINEGTRQTKKMRLKTCKQV